MEESMGTNVRVSGNSYWSWNEHDEKKESRLVSTHYIVLPPGNRSFSLSQLFTLRVLLPGSLIS